MTQRLSAGVLTFILAISLLVSVALSMLTLYIYYSRVEYLNYTGKTRLQKNLTSAVLITMGAYDHFEYGQTYAYDLYGSQQDSISILRTSWGLMDMYHVAAFKGDQRVEKVYTLGHAPDEKGRATVFLVDDGRPLSLAGDTRLTGVCYMPVAGVQSAYINRIGYRNEELIFGEELQSEKKLPEVSLKDAFDRIGTMSGVLTDPGQDTLNNSFYEELLEVRANEMGLGEVYTGNILIRSSGRLVFDSLARTSDVVAYAPVIEFKSGFKGNGQFFATDTMIIHQDVELEYPTVLACYNRDEPATILTRGKSDMVGWILMDGGKDGFRRRVVYLEDGTHFQGMIFCNGMLETYGDIDGHATVKRFLVNAQSGVYENYLMNASIDGTSLDTAFLALSQWFFKDEGQVLKYLY